MKRVDNITADIENDNAIYTDSFEISSLSAFNNGRIYQCTVVINASQPVYSSDQITLIFPGEYNMYVHSYIYNVCFKPAYYIYMCVCVCVCMYKSIFGSELRGQVKWDEQIYQTYFNVLHSIILIRRLCQSFLQNSPQMFTLQAALVWYPRKHPLLNSVILVIPPREL